MVLQGLPPALQGGGPPPPTLHSRHGPETPHSFLHHLLLPVTAKDNKLSTAHLLR